MWRRPRLALSPVDAVIAAHGQVQALGVGERSALDLAHAAPGNIRWVVVLLRAGDFAALAADALRHVEVEAVLLPVFTLRYMCGRPPKGLTCERKSDSCQLLTALAK